MHSLSLLLATALLFGTTMAMTQDESATAEKAAEAAIITEQLPSYPLDSCVITGQPLDAMGGPLDIVREGRLVRLCCKGCIKGVDKDLEAVLAKIDAAVIAKQLPDYPLDTCPVTGQKLGGMGKVIDHVHGTRLVRFCCKGCIGAFEKEPAKYLKTIDAALIEAQRATYPLDTCLVSGQALDGMGGPLDVLHGTRLVRFCCKGCLPSFRKEPAKYLALLDDAAKKGRQEGE
jgi:YHS domain-containing protein